MIILLILAIKYKLYCIYIIFGKKMGNESAVFFSFCLDAIAALVIFVVSVVAKNPVSIMLARMQTLNTFLSFNVNIARASCRRQRHRLVFRDLVVLGLQ